MNGDLRWERTTVADAIARLPLADWVDPAGDVPFWSRPRFRRAAVVAGPQHQSMLVGIRSGVPVLAAPLIASNGPGGLLFYDAPAMIGDDRAFGVCPARTEPDRLAAARTAAYPSLAVASHGAYHGVLVAPHLDEPDRARACAALPGALAATAAAHGYASHAILYATPGLLGLLAPSPPGTRIAVLGAEAVLQTDAATWEGYLAELSARRRGRVRRERRDFLSGPVRTEVAEGPGALGDDLVELRVALRERYGLPAQRELTRAEFAALARECGPYLMVIRARVADDVVGFGVFLHDGSRMYARTGGFDQDRLTSHDFGYFNVVYYAALEWGLPRGVRRVEYGLSAYPAKRTRGCRFLPRFGVFAVPPGGVLDEELREQDRSERRRLAEECGTALVRPPGWEDESWT